MKKVRVSVLFAMIGLAIMMAGRCVAEVFVRSENTNDVPPAAERIDQLKREFESLHRPLEVGTFVVSPSNSTRLYAPDAIVTIGGDGKQFLDRMTTAEAVYTLWPYLSDTNHDAEATLLLLSKLREGISSSAPLTQNSDSVVKYWPKDRKGMVARCKRCCQIAMVKETWWYPHKVLFDRKTVLAESKTNAAVRAAYVAAMQKALADPKIRTENPLEANDILGYLYILDKNAAASNFVDYIFYDARNKGEFRRKHEKLAGNDIHNDGFAVGLVALGSMGDQYLPRVLERFSKATPEERSVSVGGGALPMHAIHYFYAIRYSEEQALKAIESFKASNSNLTTNQIAALDEISAAIRTKKYRPDYFRMHEDGRPDWSAQCRQIPCPINNDINVI